MKTILQAFTGGFNEAFLDKNVLTKLKQLSIKTGASKVIIGWSVNVSYKEIVRELSAIGCEVFLWLPVFAEYGTQAIKAIDYQGNEHLNAQTKAADDFTFSCPSKKENQDIVLKYYDDYFSDCGFHGVFLDKIRFSSFGNGFTSAIGCFCDECQRFYTAKGIDITSFKQMMKKPDKSFLIPKNKEKMKYEFENPLIERLFKARADLISLSVKNLSVAFRKRDLKIGLDVFAPSFAYLFGQDISSLAESADFIKPMIYRVTDAPAGIPYESRYLKEELKNNGCKIDNQLEKLWSCQDLAGDDCFHQQLVELQNNACEVYSGLEVNRVEICKTNREYVETSMEEVTKSNLAGVVLSWNVLEDIVYP